MNLCPDQAPREREHRTVMLKEAIEATRPGEGRLIIDATAGGGGHSEALLAAGSAVIAMDQDAEALGFVKKRLARFGERARFVHANFADLPAALSQIGVKQADGLLLDLGLSSRQLDDPSRGFSFQANGPLDMRMDASSPMTAADLVNGASAPELTRIFQRFGEEPAASRIAAAIVRSRGAQPIRTTADLADLVEAVVPRRGARHPATRVFQALRMMVNGEARALHAALEASSTILRPGGRLAVITFHSLEDRAVKRFLKGTSAPFLDRPEWPSPRQNPRCFFRLLPSSGTAPSDAEIAANPRARSARLRAAERREVIPPPHEP